ncbi:MAG: DUF362 domain-containing protein [Anaerolineales bacterium]|jgi:uncharacterized protein (DUF362 family)
MSQKEDSYHIERGEFLKIIFISISAVFIKACSKVGINLATDTPDNIHIEILSSPLPEEPEVAQTIEEATLTPGEKNMSQVAFIKTNNRSEGVRQAIELLGVNPVEGKSVFLKPNFNSDDPAPGSTHPEVLQAVVLKLQEMGAAKITVGDRSGMGNTRAVMKNLGVFTMGEALGFDVVVFDELGAEEWEKYSSPNGHWQQGFAFARPILDADVVVQTCCLKTHRYGGHFTMSLKNSVGMVAKTIPGEGYNYMTELHSSPNQRKMIAEINAAYKTGLIIMDGVEAFTHGGPATGTKAVSQVVLAGTDRIAVDAVGVALLRYFGTTSEVEKGRVFEQAQIARAVEMGLGVDKPEKIQLLTADSESAIYAEEIKTVLIR